MLDRLLAEPGVTLVGLSEQDADLRERGRGRFAVTGYADYQELLARERPQAAVLAPVNRDSGATLLHGMEQPRHLGGRRRAVGVEVADRLRAEARRFE